MNRRSLLQSIPAAALLSAADLAGNTRPEGEPSRRADGTASSTRVYELRVYHPYEGKLPDLLRRFRDHTMQLFEKHGIKNVAYWVPTDAPQKGNLLVYMLAHPSREAADVNWKAFRRIQNGLRCVMRRKSTGSWSKRSSRRFLRRRNSLHRLGNCACGVPADKSCHRPLFL